MREFISMLRPSAMMLVIMSLLTGAVYPMMVTGLAQAILPAQAGGSLIARGGGVVGSELIGQRFDRPEWFWGRPSATAERPYDAAASGGSNLGPTNPALVQAVNERIAALRAVDPQAGAQVPVDLVTASASGLDPHISPEAAFYQAGRVARARGIALDQVADLVREHVEDRQWLVLGQPRVNVLKLNLDLERRFGGREVR